MSEFRAKSSFLLESAAAVLLSAAAAAAPWLLGTVPDWTCQLLDATLLAGGLLMLSAFWLREGIALRPLWPGSRRLRALLCVNGLILAWFLTSAINASGRYDAAANAVIPIPEYLPWLPHSYDQPSSWLAFWNAMGLTALFWGARAWLLGRAPENGRSGRPLALAEAIPVRVRDLALVLAATAAALAVVGSIQRLQGTDRLLWLVDDGRGAASHFGPYPYRSNAAQFLNLAWPLLFSLASCFLAAPGRRNYRVGIVFAGAAALCIAGVAAAASRGGALVGALLAILLIPATLATLWFQGFHRETAILGLASLVGIGASVPLANLLWRRLEKLPTVIPTLAPAELKEFTVDCRMVLATNRPYPLLRMYSLPTYQGLLYLDVLRNHQLRLTLRSRGTEMKTFRATLGEAAFLTNTGRAHFVLAWGPDKARLFINGRACGELNLSDLPKPDSPLPANRIHLRPIGKLLPEFRTPYLTIAMYEEPLPVSQARELSELNLAPVSGLPTPFLDLTLDNLESPTTRFYISLLGRVAIWRYTKDMLSRYPALSGAGPGTFRNLYKIHAPFLSLPDPHVHRDILETRFNLGLAGSAMALGLLFLFLAPDSLKALKHRAMWGPYAAAAGCLLHSIADFPLHNHSTLIAFTVVFALAGPIASAVPKGPGKRRRRSSRRRRPGAPDEPGARLRLDFHGGTRFKGSDFGR